MKVILILILYSLYLLKRDSSPKDLNCPLVAGLISAFSGYIHSATEKAWRQWQQHKAAKMYCVKVKYALNPLKTKQDTWQIITTYCFGSVPSSEECLERISLRRLCFSKIITCSRHWSHRGADGATSKEDGSFKKRLCWVTQVSARVFHTRG